MKIALACLALLILAGCSEPGPRYQLMDRPGTSVLRMDNRTGQVEIYTPDGWKVLDKKPAP